MSGYKLRIKPSNGKTFYDIDASLSLKNIVFFERIRNFIESAMQFYEEKNLPYSEIIFIFGASNSRSYVYEQGYDTNNLLHAKVLRYFVRGGGRQRMVIRWL